MKKTEDFTEVFLHPHTSHAGPNLCNAPGWYPVPCRTLPEPALGSDASHPSILIPGAMQDPAGSCRSHAETAEPGAPCPSWAPRLVLSEVRLPHAAAAPSSKLPPAASSPARVTAVPWPEAEGEAQQASSGAPPGFIVPFISALQQPELSWASPFGRASAPVSKHICPF